MRVQQSEQMSEMIRALGAEPVELPYGQVLTGLATKLIDGAENNWPSFVTTDHYKYAGYYTPDRTHDEPGSAGHVAEGLEQPVGRRPEDLSRSRAALQPLHARKMAGSRGAVAQAGGSRRRRRS